MSNYNQEKKDISFCDIMKEDTSEVIKKLESCTPLIFQNYSDLYTTYLHMIDDMFGTCYIAEKKFYDKLNIDQNVLKILKESSSEMKKIAFENIDLSLKIFNEYMNARKNAIKSYDDYIHTVMDSYSKFWLQQNKN